MDMGEGVLWDVPAYERPRLPPTPELPASRSPINSTVNTSKIIVLGRQ